MVRFSTLALALALASASASMPALGQSVTPSPTEVVASANPDADRLSNEVRALAANPRDVGALLNAAELSARLGDTAAANAFLTRAQNVEPTNPRIAAVRGATLVRLERPGEALRMFQQAEAAGAPMGDYLADRAFAYDLVGQPGLAQRDYEASLRRDPDEETTRRYALSLGIAGKQDEAMRVLDPLLRRSDRAAWRARAFILAMNGDPDAAQRIASSMMPGTMGQALTPFFRRLEIMTPADRAFAVHFGELRPTQSRIADARMAPPMPAFVPEPRPVAVAAVAAPPRPEQNGRRNRRDRDRVQLAAAAPVRMPLPVEPALPAPPAYTPPPQPIVQPLPQPRDTQMDEAETAPPRRAPAPRPARMPSPQPREIAPVQLAAVQPRRVQPAPVHPEPLAVSPAPAPAPQPLPIAETPPTEPAAPPPQPFVVQPAPRPEAAERAPGFVASPPPEPAPAPAPQPAQRIGQEDSAIAAIVGNLTIPASELGVNPMPGEAQPAATPAAPAPATAPRPEPAPPKPEPAKTKPAPTKPAPPKPAAKSADPKVKPAAADVKGKKKPEPAKPKTPPEPSRIWVQVAGGANETTLAKEWKRVAAKAPAAFKGRTPWTTPLRATNRVLAGPFKTSADAQAFVNTLKKADLSAFVFTSEAGQKITKLEIK